MRKTDSSGPPSLAPDALADDIFPETRDEVLADAAAGNWAPFLREYLRPCCREIVHLCRQHRVPLPDQEDLVQELLVEVFRQGRFGKQVRAVLRSLDEDTRQQANLPGRFLKHRQLPLASVRFRTYLKGAIRHLVWESLRRRWRQGPQLSPEQLEELAPAIEQTVSASIDARWVEQCLVAAALKLRRNALAARTKGRRRWFDVLYLSIAEQRSPGQIAVTFGVERSTIATLLTEARTGFVLALCEQSGLDDLAELKRVVAAVPQSLAQALRDARTAPLEHSAEVGL